MGKAVKKVKKEAKRAVKSVGKEIKRTGSSLNRARKKADDQFKSAFAFDFKPDVPDINLPEQPPQLDLEGARASEAERRRQRRSKGRASTILSTGSSESNIGKTKLG